MIRLTSWLGQLLRKSQISFLRGRSRVKETYQYLDLEGRGITRKKLPMSLESVYSLK